ncbi:hypothetical protein LEAN103870_13080 [Legionella anisa]|uniref:hypothetical protein n=1 Tax=Legionella anisa TaxID=28082 RepID=UPI00034DF552|nr:hypothetical protein [Legionella anisa]KTC68952.1 hypothetical protein Lani_2838 [Legionella anisa]MCW8424931.1 hypothetical protein [Legionella anisa]MCW8445949.1 hypothetical protein [Legionella anisa]
MPTMKVKKAMIRPDMRDNNKDILSARCSNVEINKPFSPSDVIIPNINTIPNYPENKNPAIAFAESENKNLTYCIKRNGKEYSNRYNIDGIHIFFD